ncbi:MAG: DNA repair protein RecN, partial [Clostridia bacterium]|nr:DNA repair protein RecN [Clostridia bacterium]
EVYRNSEKIAGSVNRAYDLVYRGAGRSLSALESLKKASDALGNISGLDERFEAIKSKIDEVYYLAEDAGYELQALNESIEFDPREAERVAGRLMELKRLARKYGPEISDVIQRRNTVSAQLNELEKGNEALEQINARVEKSRAQLERLAAELSLSRAELSRKLSLRIMRELDELGMKNARFEVSLSKCPLSSKGCDKVEFMLSANLGEPLKPLASVASGGELSRIMLAMKTVGAETSGVDSMVFDEIDTGISGRMAQVVGEKMAFISRNRQVICVTHLPQIAALGDRQYLVRKTVDGQRTGSTVELLDEEGRVEVLSQMISGVGSRESSLSHARNMLMSAQKLISNMNKS